MTIIFKKFIKTIFLIAIFILANCLQSNGNHSSNVNYKYNTFYYFLYFGYFQLTSSMSLSRTFHTSNLLNDGKVVIIGGSSVSDTDPAEIYDYTTGLYSNTGNMIVTRYAHTSTLLSNGDVLVVGGRNSSSGTLSSTFSGCSIFISFSTSTSFQFSFVPSVYILPTLSG